MTVLITVAGIAIPALLLTVAVRRWLDPVRWTVAALFLAMTFAFLHGAVFTTKLPVPVDEIARGYPWRGVVGEPSVKNAVTNDTVKLFLPWMAVVREEFAHFRAPLWNRYSFSGYPLLANGESAPFSPFFLATLFVPLPKQIVAMAGLKIFVSLLFGYLFVRRMGASGPAACFASTAFAWSVFQTVFLYYSTTAVTALLPAALYALFVAQQEASRRGVVLTALVVASLLANGHPESVLHIAIAAGGLLVIDGVSSADRRGWLRRFRAPVLGTLAGLALSAPTWVPVLEQVLLSARLEALRQAGGHPGLYPLTAAWAMVSPNGFGNPVRQNWNWILNYSLVASSYLGLVVMILAAVALLGRRTSARDRAWILWAALLWLVAMSWTPVGRGLSSLPPFSFVAHDKLRFAALFIAATAAARTVDAIDRRRSVTVALAACVAVALSLHVYRLRSATLRPVDLTAPAVAAAFALSCVVRPRFAPHAAFAATAVELFALNAGFNALVDQRYDLPDLPIIRALHRAAPDEPFRVAGHDWTFLPNSSARYGVEDVRGSDPMAYAAYVKLLAPIVIDDPAIDVDRVVNVDHPLLDTLGVRFLMGPPDASFGGRWQEIYRGPDGTLYENRGALSRFRVGDGKARLQVVQLAPADFRIMVEADQRATIETSQVAVNGWVVRGDGVERLPGGVFLRLAVEPGRHDVRVRYQPFSYYGSLPLAAIAAGLLLFLGRGIGPWGRTLSVVPEREAVLRRTSGNTRRVSNFAAGGLLSSERAVRPMPTARFRK